MPAQEARLIHVADGVRARLLPRDPHPGNFFIESNGTIGLVDFGMDMHHSSQAWCADFEKHEQPTDQMLACGD